MEIIRLPSYTSKDPVDGIFMVVLVVILIALVGACAQGCRKHSHRRVRDRDRTARDLETELTMNEEDGSREIGLKESSYHE
jgi:hypothetical protein